LKDHPRRAEILSENPDLSASDARKVISDEKANEEEADGWSIHRSADEWSKDREGFRKDGLVVVNKVSAMWAIVRQCTDEQIRGLADPVWWAQMEQAREELTQCLDRRNEVLEAEANEAVSEGQIRLLPAPASAPDQPGA
jgi:hypothetical protein